MSLGALPESATHLNPNCERAHCAPVVYAMNTLRFLTIVALGASIGLGGSSSPSEMDVRRPGRFFDGPVAAKADSGGERDGREEAQRVHGVHRWRALRRAYQNWVRHAGALSGAPPEAHFAAFTTTLPVTVSGSPCTFAERVTW